MGSGISTRLSVQALDVDKKEKIADKKIVSNIKQAPVIKMKRSRISVDQSTVNGDSSELERMKRAFEMYKMDRDNEMKCLEKEKKKLEGEKRRLRNQVSALEKTVAKVKSERDTAVEGEIRALERAAVLEAERNKIQKQFKIYRETYENKLHHMYKTQAYGNCNSLPSSPAISLQDSLCVKTRLSADDESDDDALDSPRDDFVIDGAEETSLAEELESRRWSANVQWIPEDQLQKLTAHVTQPGPLPPFLLLGDPGSGKSLLLGYWIATLPEEKTVVLYHEVRNERADGSHVGVMVHRLMRKMTTIVQRSSFPVINPERLASEFPFWLEKVWDETEKRRLVLILDSADKFQNAMDELIWLLDPLPVNVRVIVSADAVLCPHVWKLWPTLRLSSMCGSAIRSILFGLNLNEVQLNHVVDCLTAKPSTSLPLHINVIRNALNKWTHQVGSVDSFQSSLMACNDTVSLYTFILERLQGKDAAAHTLLSLLCSSRNGVCANDLATLVPGFTDAWWQSTLCNLSSVCLIAMSATTVFPAHDVAREAMTIFCFGDKTTRSTNISRQLVCHYESIEFQERVEDRVADELPWLLRETGDARRLKKFLGEPRVFYSLFSRNRSSLLLSHWKWLNVDCVTMADVYLTPSVTRDANILESLGIFFRQLGLFTQSFIALQRGLEVREIQLDPDHPLIAQMLHQLAVLHFHWGKVGSAEIFHKQALDMYESSLGCDHHLVIRELELLIKVYRKQRRHELVEPLQRRITTVMDH